LNVALCDNFVTIETIYGNISGILHPEFPVEVFRGIPYAKPPIEDLRWKLPVPIDPWGVTLNATSFAPACIQHGVGNYQIKEVSEDCLYLNIYRSSERSQTNLAPVMIYIHGGAFSYGSGEHFDGSWLALKGAIVVTINYRLNLFGFGSAGSGAFTENYGLLDQQRAINFTSKIISQFGGNPERITIFGSESGGGSVMLHLLNPQNKGLVQRGISQSGSVYTPDSSTAVSSLRAVCIYLSMCHEDTEPHKIINILKHRTTTEFIDALKNLAPLNFGPSDNDGVFTDEVLEEMFSAEISCFDFMAGWNNRDGSFRHKALDIKDVNELESFTISGNWIGGSFNAAQNELAFKHYSPRPPLNRWEDFWTDGMFVRPTLQLADRLVTSGCERTYVYRLSYNVPTENEGYFPSRNPGTSHLDQLNFLSWSPDLSLSEDEMALSNLLIDFWFQFADSFQLQHWPEYGAFRKIYDIESKAVRTIEFNYEERSFWDKLMETVQEPPIIGCVDDPENMFSRHGLSCDIVIHDEHMPCYVLAKVVLSELDDDTLTFADQRICPVRCNNCPNNDNDVTSDGADFRPMIVPYFILILAIVNYFPDDTQ